MRIFKASCIVFPLALLLGGCAHHTAPAARTFAPRSVAAPAGGIRTLVVTVSADAAAATDDEDAFADDSLDFLNEEENEAPPSVADPLSGWNRAMFTFNDRAYFWVLKPVAKAYKAVAPEPMRVGIKNFFYNLAMPIRLANCLLQGKFKSAGLELERFFINSTVGCAGLGDLSPLYPDLQIPPEDLGQTFGRYGAGEGIYIVWPLLGPSTLRDTLGKIGDIFIDPVTYFNTATIGMGTRVFDTINDTSLRLGDYEAIKESALDPYVSFRNGYIQFRRKQIHE